jgi:hypothetical protein
MKQIGYDKQTLMKASNLRGAIAKKYKLDVNRFTSNHKNILRTGSSKLKAQE